MKHQHWSFKANTETFDGRRAVKEAWAAGLQIVTFETETHAVTLTTEDMYEKLVERSVAVSAIEILDDGQRFYPNLDVSGVCAARDRSTDDLPPYTVWLDADAAEVREMIAQLKKPQRVAVSGYGFEAQAEEEIAAPTHAPDAQFVWQGPGVYLTRDGCRVRVVSNDTENVYPYRTPSGSETYGACGQVYARAEEDSHATDDDLVGGKVAEL